MPALRIRRSVHEFRCVEIASVNQVNKIADLSESSQPVAAQKMQPVLGRFRNEVPF